MNIPINLSHFHPHLELAHRYWKELLQPGDHAIDATCGNGKDTLKLAQLLHSTSQLITLDIQSLALQRTQQFLREHLPIEQLSRIHFFQQSHVEFPSLAYTFPIKLIVYNLGYLPGGEKSITTQTMTTLMSLSAAQSLIARGGMISITCYPGHDEGKMEQEALLNTVKALNSNEWQVLFHNWPNRPCSPNLLLLSKSYN